MDARKSPGDKRRTTVFQFPSLKCGVRINSLKRFRLRMNLQSPEAFWITKKGDINWSGQSDTASMAPLSKNFVISCWQVCFSDLDKAIESSLIWEGGWCRKGNLYPEIDCKMTGSDVISLHRGRKTANLPTNGTWESVNVSSSGSASGTATGDLCTMSLSSWSTPVSHVWQGRVSFPILR